ncbi:MAG: hypothetical protein BWY76_02054 [bacterium ADurb.Bin429]|nr:MAG: hypothetical protein BWY76_02054 [bacterium ADurb.Bin429]
MEMPKPHKEHQWLRKFVGEWTAEGEGIMEPDQPPMTWKGTESVRSIGGFWVMGEGRGEDPEGGEAITIMTLGYDPQKQRFVGTFFGSMMTNLWIYEGVLDADERVLTLDTEGPNMMAEGALARFQDITEFVSDDHRILTSRMLDENGQWHQFMTAHYRRKT